MKQPGKRCPISCITSIPPQSPRSCRQRPPFNLRDETTFDARATARYLIGFVPDGLGPPHFLDDPIEADFTVDHLPQLLSLYGRELQLKLRRTDQAPGALAGGAHPADEPISTLWKSLPLKLMGARRIVA